MKRLPLLLLLCGVFLISLVPSAAQGGDTPNPKKQEAAEVKACAETAFTGLRPIADDRAQRFQGKVTQLTALCRGGTKAVQFRATPWIDFTNYWGTGDLSSLPKGYLSTSAPQFRGVSGALLDLEYQRIELIKFNLFDNNGTYPDYVAGRGSVRGAALKTWPQMRLLQSDPNYLLVGGDGEQVCRGQLIRARTLTGNLQRPSQPAVGRTGVSGVRGQLVDRAKFLSQPFCSRAQLVCR